MRLFILSASLACFAGCIIHTGGGNGGSGPATFAFGNCSGDCGLDDHAVAAGGARTTIHVNGVTYADVRSSDPSVATFARSNADIAVTSGAPGTTTLQLLDGAGRVVASGVVTVVATAQLKVNHGWTGSGPRVLAGSTQIFHVTTLDDKGDVTKGDGSVTFTFGGTLSPAVAPLSGDAVAFVGTPGDGTITADCPNASVTQSITVVDPADITELTTSVAVEANDTAIVSVVAQSAGGGVYAGPCAWQTSDPSVTLGSEIGPSLELGPGTIDIFNLNRSGTFTATCTLAGKTATVTLQR